MNRGFFITGTDTEVGKTWCSLGLIARLQRERYTVAAMKPVASGCLRTDGGELRNDDALRLQAGASALHPYELVNPYAFEPAIAPHIAAAQSNARIEFARISERFQQLRQRAEITVVEGVGGWRVPLNETQGVAELAAMLALPVILVVGLRLGCINHALLSAESIRASGCRLAGWIANTVDPGMQEQADTIHSIASRIDAPLLGTIPHLATPDVERMANALSLPASF